jgi:hypothetical protein
VESIGIIRSLSRHRIALVLGALLAFCAGVLAIYEVSIAPPDLRTRTVVVGHAQEHVLVDTAESLLVDANAEDAESIGTRAIILSDLLADDQARERIARAAGVRSEEIAVVGLGTTVPDVGTPLAERALEVVQARAPYQIYISEGPSLPILSILATAPERNDAERLARAATQTMALLARRAPAVGANLRIDQLGKGTSWSQATQPSKVKALLASTLVFLAWATTIFAFDRFQRRRSPRVWQPKRRVPAA